MARTPDDEERRGLVRAWDQYGELSAAGLLAGWFDWLPLFKGATDWVRSPRRLRLVPQPGRRERSGAVVMSWAALLTTAPDGKLRVQFSEPLRHIDMDRETARHLAALLVVAAEEPKQTKEDGGSNG